MDHDVGQAQAKTPRRSPRVGGHNDTGESILDNDIPPETENEELSNESIISDMVSSLQDHLVDGIETDPALLQSNVSDCDAIIADFIAENYHVQRRNEILDPPISSLLGDTIMKWAMSMPTKDDIKTAFEKCKIPENIAGLMEIRINENIFNRLSVKAKDSDRKMRSQANYVLRAMGPLAYVWNICIKADAFAMKNKKQIPGLVTSSEIVPIRSLTACLSAAMKLLCITNALNLQKRKYSLKPYLDPKFHILVSPNNSVTKNLFGDNLEQKISEIYKVSQAARNPRFSAMRTKYFDRSNYTRNYTRGGSRQYRGNRFKRFQKTGSSRNHIWHTRKYPSGGSGHGTNNNTSNYRPHNHFNRGSSNRGHQYGNNKQ